MKKFFAIIFVAVFSLLVGCSDDSTKPTENKVVKSVMMPDFIMPLADGNYWEYMEIKGKKRDIMTIKYDTIKFIMKLRNPSTFKWERTLTPLKSFEIISDRIYTIRDKDTVFYLPEFIGNGSTENYLAADKDTLKIGYYDKYDGVVRELFLKYYPFKQNDEIELNTIKPKSILLNYKLNQTTYDSVFVFESKKFDDVYYFVKGIGFIRHFATDDGGTYETILTKYSVK